MDKINSKQLYRLKEGEYCIWNNNKYALIKTYSKFKWYMRDLKDLLIELLSAILTILVFPIELIIIIFKFIPSLYKIKDNNK